MVFSALRGDLLDPLLRKAHPPGLSAHDDQVFHLADEIVDFLARFGLELKLHDRLFLGREKEKLIVRLDIPVEFVKDKLGDDKPLGPCLVCFRVFIDDVDHRLFIGHTDPRGVFDIELFRNVNDLIGAIFEENEQLVEIRTGELLGAGNLCPDKSFLRVESDFYFLGLNGPPVDLFDRLDARFSRKLFAVFFDQCA